MNRTLAAAAVFALMGCGSSDAPQNPQSVASGPVVFMGDSITAQWSSGLAQHVPDSVDVGVPGQTSEQMLARFQTDVLSRSPAVIVILAGTNDLIDADPSTDAVATMADEAAQAGAHVILCLIPPENPSDAVVAYKGYTSEEAVQSWNADLRLLAQAHGYQVADYYTALVTTTDFTQNLTLFDADEVHPNLAGEATMWQVLRPLLLADGVTID